MRGWYFYCYYGTLAETMVSMVIFLRKVNKPLSSAEDFFFLNERTMYRLTRRFSQSPSVSVSDTRCPSAHCPALFHTAGQSRQSCPWFHWAPPSSAPSETCWWPAASSFCCWFAVNAVILFSAYSKTECKHSSLLSYDHVHIPVSPQK